MMRSFRILKAIAALIAVAATCSGLSTARAQGPGTFFVSDDRDGSVKQFTNTGTNTYNGSDLGPAGTFVVPRGLALQAIPSTTTARLWGSDLLTHQIFTYGGGTWTPVSVPNQSSIEYINGMAFNTSGNLLFVASHPGATDNGAGNIYEYNANGTALSLAHTFTGSLGGQISNPSGLYFSPAGTAGTLYVTSSGLGANPGSIVAIDVATNNATTVVTGLNPAAGPGGVYYRTDGNGTYADVANAFDGTVSLVEYTLTGANAGSSRVLARGLNGAVDPFYADGLNLYVTGFGGSIYAVPLAGESPRPLTLLLNGSPYTTGEYSYAIALPSGVTLAGVPEPSSIALLGLGAAGFLGYRRARSRRPASV